MELVTFHFDQVNVYCVSKQNNRPSSISRLASWSISLTAGTDSSSLEFVRYINSVIIIIVIIIIKSSDASVRTLTTELLCYVLYGSDLCTRFDWQGQNWHQWSLRHGQSWQGDETNKDCATRSQPCLERKVLLVSTAVVCQRSAA